MFFFDNLSFAPDAIDFTESPIIMKRLSLSFLLPVVLLSISRAAPPKEDAADPSKVDADYAIQGEYTGSVKGEDGNKKLGCQVVALGEGSFMARGFVGGLPGDGWNLTKEETVQGSKAKDGAVSFKNDKHRGVIKDGVMVIHTLEGKKIGQLKRVVRKSPRSGPSRPRER